MARVFVNYRTGDGDQLALLVERDLTHRFGQKHVFLASRSVPAGEEFDRVIRKNVRRSDVLVAIIGPAWFTIPAHRDPDRRAVDDPADWPRREIVEAFSNDVLVVPLLVGATPRLQEDDLPAELRFLARVQSLRFHRDTAEVSLDRLAGRLEDVVPALRDLARQRGAADGSGDAAAGGRSGGSAGGGAPGVTNLEFHEKVDGRGAVFGTSFR